MSVPAMELPPELRETPTNNVEAMRQGINWGKVAKRALIIAAITAAGLGAGHAAGLIALDKIPYVGAYLAGAANYVAPRAGYFWNWIRQGKQAADMAFQNTLESQGKEITSTPGQKLTDTAKSVQEGGKKVLDGIKGSPSK